MTSDISPIRESDYPTLSDAGRQMLHFMREHRNAPLYRNQSGNRLTLKDLEDVRVFERELEETSANPRHEGEPEWLRSFTTECFSDVPHYRLYGSLPSTFNDIPTISRSDLGRDITRFVPDSLPIDRLINFRTSGTSGHPLLIPSHPVVAGCYLPLHLRALRRFGVEPSHGSGQVGVVLVGWQKECFTYTSVTPSLGESGLAKINLHPGDWRDPDDRARYLEALNPEVCTGDPLSFHALLELPVTISPRALISTSMTLLPGLRERLEKRFCCPVLDIYSMNEAGPIAVADPDAGGHVILQHRLYVEILDEDGRCVPPGTRGEITITGGFNFCLPLLRYRTGDYASLRRHGSDMVLERLEGRPPVMFRTMSGELINNVEITHALRPFGLARFSVHQEHNGSLIVRLQGSNSEWDAVRNALRCLFGNGQQITLLTLDSDSKVFQYTTALCGDKQ